MSEPVSPLALEQINIVVREMQRSLAFYRLLGVSIEDIPAPEWGSVAIRYDFTLVWRRHRSGQRLAGSW